MLCCSVIVFGCQKKMTSGKTDTAKTTTTTPVKTETPATPPANTATPPAAETGRINTEALAAAQKVYEGNCAKCHALKNPETYTAERWVGILNWMAPKAKLSDEQKAQVLTYVQHNAKDAPKDKSNM